MNKRLIWVEGDDFTAGVAPSAYGASLPRTKKAPWPRSRLTASRKIPSKSTTAQAVLTERHYFKAPGEVSDSRSVTNRESPEYMHGP